MQYFTKRGLIYKWSRTILMSLIPAIVGAGIAFVFFHGSTGLLGNTRLFVQLAGSSALLSGAFCWWMFIERAEQVTRRYYISAGLVCGILAHPLMWLIFFALTEMLGAGLAVGATLYSWMYAGWLTAGIGAIGGWLFALWVNRLNNSSGLFGIVHMNAEK